MVRQRVSIHNCLVTHQTTGLGTERGDVVNGAFEISLRLDGYPQARRNDFDAVSDSGSRVSSFVCLCVYISPSDGRGVIAMSVSTSCAPSVSATVVVKAP